MVQVIRKTPSLLLRLPVTTHTQQQHQAATTAMMVASPSSQATSQERGAHQPPELRGIEAPRGPLLTAALGDPTRGSAAGSRSDDGRARWPRLGWTTAVDQTRVPQVFRPCRFQDGVVRTTPKHRLRGDLIVTVDMLGRGKIFGSRCERIRSWFP